MSSTLSKIDGRQDALDRREFLRRTAASSAACSWLGQAVAEVDGEQTAAAPGQIIDAHTYIDAWPFARFENVHPPDLVNVLRNANISQAWVGSLAGLFHKDLAAANARLAERCERDGHGLLIPFGSVNPLLPDWEEDLRRCHEVHRMPGIRLHPNYHGYMLDDDRFGQALAQAAACGLAVHLVTGMTTQRRQYLKPAAARVDLRPLADQVRRVPQLKLLVSDEFQPEGDSNIESLLSLPDVYFDISQCVAANRLADLSGEGSSDRILFGSFSPFENIEAALLRADKVAPNEAARRSLVGDSARRFLK